MQIKATKPHIRSFAVNENRCILTALARNNDLKYRNSIVAGIFTLLSRYSLYVFIAQFGVLLIHNVVA